MFIPYSEQREIETRRNEAYQTMSEIRASSEVMAQNPVYEHITWLVVLSQYKGTVRILYIYSHNNKYYSDQECMDV